MLEFRPMLEFRGVDTHYADLRVLKSVDYRIAAGEIVACWAATPQANRRR
jgi:ABC-type branched-subunit amino acid transport system ATPase component